MLIREQRKTTHATRSLAITFVAAPVVAVVVTIAEILAIKSGNTEVIITAGLLGLGSLIWVLIRSLAELAESSLN